MKKTGMTKKSSGSKGSGGGKTKNEQVWPSNKPGGTGYSKGK